MGHKHLGLILTEGQMKYPVTKLFHLLLLSKGNYELLISDKLRKEMPTENPATQIRQPLRLS
jgi:hypothetical protein